MRRSALVLIFLLTGCLVFAQKAETTLTQGSVKLKDSAGKLRDLEIGELLSAGESVITGAASQAELRLLSGSSRIRVRPNSVLLFGEKKLGGQSQTALQAVAGSVSIKFEKLTEKEPLVGTGSCMAAVRGTEVEIYAGMDGSSLLAVISGAVALESGGVELDLEANEAVEVRSGQAPGAKFAWLGRELDYSAWNQGRLSSFLANPVSSALEIETQLKAYAAAIHALLPELAEGQIRYDEAYAQLKKLVEAGDASGAAELRTERFFPLMQAQGILILNIRFYALSALSLRRFALGGMYMELRSRTPLIAETGEYGAFMEIYRRILANFETDIVPQLVEADI